GVQTCSSDLLAIIISSLAQPSCLAALQALEFGAVDVLAKPGGPYSVGELRQDLADKVRAAAPAPRRPREPGQTVPTGPAFRARHGARDGTGDWRFHRRYRGHRQGAHAP